MAHNNIIFGLEHSLRALQFSAEHSVVLHFHVQQFRGTCVLGGHSIYTPVISRELKKPGVGADPVSNLKSDSVFRYTCRGFRHRGNPILTSERPVFHAVVTPLAANFTGCV